MRSGSVREVYQWESSDEEAEAGEVVLFDQ